jgi:hypothetical protein
VRRHAAVTRYSPQALIYSRKYAEHLCLGAILMLSRAKWGLRKPLPMNCLATIMETGRARFRTAGEDLIANSLPSERRPSGRLPSFWPSPSGAARKKSASSHSGGGSDCGSVIVITVIAICVPYSDLAGERRYG